MALLAKSHLTSSAISYYHYLNSHDTVLLHFLLKCLQTPHENCSSFLKNVCREHLALSTTGKHESNIEMLIGALLAHDLIDDAFNLFTHFSGDNPPFSFVSPLLRDSVRRSDSSLLFKLIPHLWGHPANLITHSIINEIQNVNFLSCLDEFSRKSCLSPSDAESVDGLIVRLNGKVRWKSKKAFLTEDHRCSYCGSSVKILELSTSQFQSLRSCLVAQFKNPLEKDNYVDVGETDHFIRFVAENGPFAVVVDVLNALHGTVKNTYRFNKIMNSLESRFSEDLARKFLLVVPRYLESWVSKFTSSRVVAYLMDQSRNDDVFVLSAAITSGESCFYVSNDKFRDFNSNLGNFHSLLFGVWQGSRQITSTTSGSLRPVFPIPSLLTYQPFEEQHFLHISLKGDKRNLLCACGT